MFNEKSDGKGLVELFYQVEEDEMAKTDVSLKQSISVRVETSHATMLNALSKRFGQSRSSIIQHLVEAEAVKMFNALTDSDKEKLALEADEETTKLMLDAGHQIKSSNAAGNFENEWSDWRSHFRTRQILEKRAQEEGE